VRGPSSTARARRHHQGTSLRVSVMLGLAVTRSLRWFPAKIEGDTWCGDGRGALC
jgi:hypothetical protein